MKLLGENLRKIRTDRGMTQGEAAKKAGVTQAMMSAFERGQGDPALSTLRKLATAFNLSLSELFSHDPPPPPPSEPRPPTKEEMAMFIIGGINITAERRDALRAILTADAAQFERISACLYKIRLREA